MTNAAGSAIGDETGDRALLAALGDLLDRRCVAVRSDAATDEQAIRQAADLLTAVGATTAEYAEAAVERERTYPTGLPTAPVGVALPHADRGACRPALALLTFRTPVSFGEMGADGTRVPVQILVLLAVPAGDTHVQALGALAQLLQQPAFLEGLLRAPTPDALFAAFRRWTRGSSSEE